MINNSDKARQLRTCQECGHVQFTSLPVGKADAAYWKWAELQCRKCKSEALDFGNTVQPGADSEADNGSRQSENAE